MKESEDSVEKVLMFSGGMDSIVAWYYTGKPACVHVTGHSRYSFEELYAVTKFMERHEEMECEIVEMDWLADFEEEDATIPLRNAHFAMIGAHFADKVLIPCQLGEQNIPDRSPQFFTEVSSLLSYLQKRPVKVDPVFPNMTKQDMVKWYLDSGHNRAELWLSYSCFSGKTGRCGECSACFRTAVALDSCDILPERFFMKDIWKWEGIKDYIHKMDKGQYEEKRTKQTMSVLKKHGLV